MGTTCRKILSGFVKLMAPRWVEQTGVVWPTDCRVAIFAAYRAASTDHAGLFSSLIQIWSSEFEAPLTGTLSPIEIAVRAIV